MPSNVLSAAERTRILELAKKHHSVRQIAERYGVNYDRIRHLIGRAEEAGQVPAGTLLRCGVIPRQSKSRSA
jgi:transposase